MKKFDIWQYELAEILIKRANALKDVSWYLELETQIAIDNVESVLNEYKERVKKFQKERPMKK